jgi:small subunit ribosomal protein S13
MKSFHFKKLINSPQDYKKIKDKSLLFFLCNFFGINKKGLIRVFSFFGLNEEIKVKHISFSLFKDVLMFIEKDFLLENQLRKKIIFFRKYYVKNKHLKGLRSINGYPLRGQRTHSNANTARKLIFRY